MKAFGCNAGNRQSVESTQGGTLSKCQKSHMFCQKFLTKISDETLKSLPRFGGFLFALKVPAFCSPVPVRFSPQYNQYESTVMRFVKDFLLDRAGLNNVMLHMLFVQAP